MEMNPNKLLSGFDIETVPNFLFLKIPISNPNIKTTQFLEFL